MSSSAFTPTTTQVTTEVPVNVPVVTAWTAYTPATITGYTTSSSLYEWRRLGDTIQVRGRFLTASTSATAASFTLPSGLTARSVTVQTNGLWTRATTASSQIKTGHLYSTNGSNVINFSSGNFSTSDNPQSTFNGSGWGGSGEVIVFEVWAVINEWAGSGTTTLADRALEEYAWNSDETASSNTSSFSYGADGVLFPNITAHGTSINKRVRFTTPILSTDSIILEYQQSSSGSWRSASARFPLVQSGAAGYGIELRNVNSTDIDVGFRAQGAISNGATYASNGELWSLYRTDNWKWRVRKISAGAQVGYPISTKNIVGATDGVAPVTGMLGEKVTWSVQPITQSVTVSETDWTNSSITLGAGTWLLSAQVCATIQLTATAGNDSELNVKITDASNNEINRQSRSIRARTPASAINLTTQVISLSTVVSISSTTTYKIRVRKQDNVGTAAVSVYNEASNYSDFFAIRIA
jgi:hypothetical protein